MTKNENVNMNQLPEEWIELVKEAMKSNITKEDFKRFLAIEEEKRKNNGFK